MENKQIFFYVLVILIVAGVGILFWRDRQVNDRFTISKHNRPSDTFEQTAEQLTKLNEDLLSLINEKTGTDLAESYKKYLGVSPADMVGRVKRAMEGRFMLSTFTMEGDSMDAPVLKMYANNKKLFELLGSVGYLTMLGKIIATSAWASSSTNPSPENLDAFWQYTDNIDWTFHVTWVNLATTVHRCMKQ